MRARWEFHFDCTGIRFERVHEYEAPITEEDAEGFGLPAVAFTALIRLEPDEKSYNPMAEQTGKLKITVPGKQQETESLAYWMARHVTEQVTFSQGEMKINYGLVLGELLPDTPEEAEQLGEKRFFAKAQLVEVIPPPAFDGSTLAKVSSSPLMKQFNAADRATNPIDRFLGLFKILEDLYGPTSGKVKIADSLKASAELFQLTQKHLHLTENGINRPPTQAEYHDLIDKLVKVRHECAHLRSSKKFGITHGDHRVTTEVEPLIRPLRSLAFEAVQGRL
jgi:hypothetical protein